MKKTCIAVIGCGRIADRAHFPVFKRLNSVRVKYACDIIREKAEAKKKEYPDLVENVIEDYKIALQDKEVEAVYVLTPNYQHCNIVIDALNAGKHVFCEKPITVNFELSKKMQDTANKVGKILVIGVCNRYQRSVELLEKMNREGVFGDIYHVYCSFRSYRSIPGLGGAFTTKAQSGGGVLIDWGVHFLDLILYILGNAKIKTVTCDTYCGTAKKMEDYVYNSMWAEDTKDLNGVNDVEDFVTGYIRTDKSSVSFNGSWAQNIDKEEMYVDFLGDKAGARLTYCGDFTLYTTNNGLLEEIHPKYNIPDMYECETRAFFDSIRSGEKTKNNIDNVMETAKLLDALYASAEQKKELKF